MSGRQRNKVRSAEAPSPSPADGDESDLDPHDLRLRLNEKECLVAALTERLEQAADQLDRARRTGNRDRGGAAVPSELIAGQRGLLEELHEAIGEWRDWQGTTTLGQIAMQIEELRDLVAGRILGDPAEPGALREPPHSDDTEPGEELAGEFSFPAAQPACDAIEEPGDEPPPPEPVDFEAADAEALTLAIRVRDEYIAWLIRKLRHERTRKDGPVDADVLAQAPEELSARLTARADRLEESLRLAEIEFSMERARLSREEAQLRLREEQARRLARQLERAAAQPETDDEPETDHPRSNRWLKLLGLGRESQD